MLCGPEGVALELGRGLRMGLASRQRALGTRRLWA